MSGARGLEGRRTVLSAMALLGCLAARAGAQEPQTIFVDFQFKASSFTTMLASAPRAEMEKKIAADLARVLAGPTRFPYWTFRRGDAEALPRLSIWLERGHPDWEVRMSLVTSAGPAGEPWKGRLFAPGDLELFGGLPSPEAWPDAILTAFDGRLLSEQREKVLAVLADLVPLGVEVVPVGPMPPASPQLARAVLPLQWEHHCRLARAEFRVVYSWAQGGEVTLHSVGIVMPFQFNPAFQGITILHREWEFGGSPESISGHLRDLKELTPVSFYLVKPNTFSRPCSTAAEGPGLSVAP
ncbi:MAG TPA: hypothetical protein VKH43_11180 [Thermoanaerobaculia bacterium]|nr:hypothetical protein [Thermoanaerobaculia bacterium]